MRRWRRAKAKGRKRAVPNRPGADAETLREFAGKWVAIRDGKVLAAFETFDRVYEYLEGERERGATILRVPAEDEPEMVGFG